MLLLICVFIWQPNPTQWRLTLIWQIRKKRHQLHNTKWPEIKYKEEKKSLNKSRRRFCLCSICIFLINWIYKAQKGNNIFTILTKHYEFKDDFITTRSIRRDTLCHCVSLCNHETIICTLLFISRIEKRQKSTDTQSATTNSILEPDIRKSFTDLSIFEFMCTHVGRAMCVHCAFTFPLILEIRQFAPRSVCCASTDITYDVAFKVACWAKVTYACQTMICLAMIVYVNTVIGLIFVRAL